MCIEPTEEDLVTIHHELGHDFYFQQLLQAADPLSAGGQRRLPRGHRRHARAHRDARVPEDHRAARRGAEERQGADQPADEDGARQGRVPAVRAARSTSGAGTCSPARRRPRSTTRRGGRCATQVPGRGAARRAHARPTSTRARSSTSPASTPYIALLPRAHLPVPVPPGALQGRGLHGAARPVLDLREQGRGREAAARCSRWARASRGRTRSRRSAASAKADATAILEYFAPLAQWLDEQNKGEQCGW